MFTITKETQFVIYGASFIGKEINTVLKEKGYDVVAFFDTDAKNGKIVDGVQVLHPEEELSGKERTVIIIAITDTQEHEAVAEYLYSIGYDKIIMQTDFIKNEKQIVDEIYERILIGENVEAIEIPCFEPAEDGWEKFEDKYVDVIEGKYVVDVPVELLFFEKADGVLCTAYQNEPLLTAYHFLEGRENADLVFEYFESRDEAIRWIQVESVRYKNLSRRWQVYGHDINKAQIPWVERNEKGVFVVKTEEPYAMFQVVKGYSRVKCVMSESDYRSWVNIDKVDNFYELMKKHHVSRIYTPIPHPAMYDIVANRENYGYTRLARMCRYFSEQRMDIKGKKVLDVGTYVGYLGQHMYRMGADVTAVEYANDLYELCDSINDILGYRLDLKHMGIEELETEDQYDVTIMLTVLYWHLDTPLADKIMKKVDEVTKGILVWESGNEIEREKEWIMNHSSFNHYEKIADSFGAGKLRELGVFSRV